MKITRRQIRKIISETMRFSGGGKSIDQARADMGRALAGEQPPGDPSLAGWEDLTDLETTLWQLLSFEGQEMYEQTFGPGSYSPVHDDFDADGIWNGGKNIIAALERLGLAQSLDSVYHYVFQKWAEQNTGGGIFTELDYDSYWASQGQ